MKSAPNLESLSFSQQIYT